MGIELPAELVGAAAKAGVRWPEADEDRMRESASAWREAARSVETLSRVADATAQGALGGFRGATADAVGRKWAGFVDEGGLLPASARECTAAADRLENAAQRIGETKVELVRELTTLARNTDVAEQAAKAGHPQAAAALDSAVRGATANAARLHETLATTVGPGTGAVGEAGNGAADAAAGPAKSTVEEVAPGAERGVSDTVGQAAPGMQESVGGVAAGAQHAIGDVPPGGTGDADPVDRPPGENFRDVAEPSTGPIPVIGGSGAVGGTSEAEPTTAPHAVQSAWAAAPAQPPQPTGQPPQVYGPPPPQQGGPLVPPAAAAAPGAGVVGQPPQQVAGPRPPAQAPGAQGPPAPPARPAPWSQQPGPPNQLASNQPVRRAPLMPPQNPPQAQQQASESPQRGLRNGPRNADAVAILLHQFPIGHLPVASHGASSQLPPPEVDQRPGLNFPPQDHPRSRLVDDSEALARAGSGELYRAAQQDRLERDDPAALPADLLVGHDELGELSELDWERRYTTGEGADRGYVWPPSAEFPEGAHETGQPVVLDPGTVLDLLGSAANRVFHAAGSPFANRSLPAEHARREHRDYRVVHPLPVWRSVAAPWFEQPGGGLRYRATYSADDLVALGYLVELTRARRISEASTLRIDISGRAAPSGDDEREVQE